MWGGFLFAALGWISLWGEEFRHSRSDNQRREAGFVLSYGPLPAPAWIAGYIISSVNINITITLLALQLLILNLKLK